DLVTGVQTCALPIFTGPLEFRDVLGREHRGERGDYLVESSDGLLRIAPREIFEDVYVAMDVAMDSAAENRPQQTRPRFSISDLRSEERRVGKVCRAR